MLKKKWMLLASSLVVALGLTACSGEDVKDSSPAKDNDQIEQDNQDHDNDKIEDKGSSANKDLSNYNDIELTVNDAYNKFIEENLDVNLEKIELDYDDNTYFYKIEGHDGDLYHEMKINAITGDITKDEEKDKDKEDILDLKYLNKIDEFVQKSLNDSGEGFISMEWDLDIKDGIPELEVEIEREDGELEYTYNLDTGELLEKDS